MFLPLLYSIVVNSANNAVNRVLCQWIGWSSLEKCLVEERNVHTFSHSFFDMMPNRFNNSFGEIEALPAIIHAVTASIKGKLNGFHSSDAAEGLLQDKALEVLHLYREATESVDEFVLCGKSLMEDMVNHYVDDIQTAFDEEKYHIIDMRLGDVGDHLTKANKTLETAKVKLKTAVSATDDL